MIEISQNEQTVEDKPPARLARVKRRRARSAITTAIHQPASLWHMSSVMEALPMRNLPVMAMLLGLGGCAGPVPLQRASGNPPLVAAEKLIDAFYSFDPRRLLKAMADAPASQPQILFYQGWAEGGNYAIIKRQPCQFVSDSEVTCAITVRDDLIVALGTGYWVTDKFHLTLHEGRIVKVSTSSDDPPEFDLALDWLKRKRPDIMTGPCVGFFEGGPTPQNCVRAVVREFRSYRASKSDRTDSRSWLACGHPPG